MKIKLIFSSIGFFVAGGAAGYFVTRKYLESTYERLANEAVDTYIKESKETESVDPTEEVALEEVPQEVIEEIKKMKKEKVQYHKVASNYTRNEDLKAGMDLVSKSSLDEAPEYPNEYHDELPSSTIEEPVVISLEEFTNEKPTFDKVSLTYYEVDNALCDENEELIPEIASIIGEDALFMFGQGTEDPDIVYVRNQRLGADYEIVRLPKSYSELVLGIVEAKPIAKTKKKKSESEEEDN